MSDLEQQIAEEERALLQKRIDLIKSMDFQTVNASDAWKKMVAHSLKAGFDRLDFEEKLNSPSHIIFSWNTSVHTPVRERMEAMRNVIIGELTSRMKISQPSGPSALRLVK